MTFSGHANSSTLYTNNLFYWSGVHGIYVNVTNNSSSTLTVTWKQKNSTLWFDGTVDSMTVSPGESKSMYQCEDLDIGAYYYITFSAPSDFTGSVNTIGI